MGLALRLAAVEKADMLGPRHVDEHADIPLFSQLEQPRRRHVIDANGIDAQAPHLSKVAAHCFRGGKLMPMFIRCERTVCHPLHPETISAATKPQPIDNNTLVFGRWFTARRRVCAVASHRLDVFGVPGQQSRHRASWRFEFHSVPVKRAITELQRACRPSGSSSAVSSFFSMGMRANLSL